MYSVPVDPCLEPRAIGKRNTTVGVGRTSEGQPVTKRRYMQPYAHTHIKKLFRFVSSFS
jgi:hypothetical protein